MCVLRGDNGQVLLESRRRLVAAYEPRVRDRNELECGKKEGSSGVGVVKRTCERSQSRTHLTPDSTPDEPPVK